MGGRERGERRKMEKSLDFGRIEKGSQEMGRGMGKAVKMSIDWFQRKDWVLGGTITKITTDWTIPCTCIPLVLFPYRTVGVCQRRLLGHI